MTCASTTVTFRLLDDVVGWEEESASGLVGFDAASGVRLAGAGASPDGPTRTELLPWFPDPRLAPGCRPGTWYLLSGDRLLRRDTCPGGWLPAWPPQCDPGLLRTPVAVAARGHRVAVADAGQVLVWRNEGDQLAAVIPVPGAGVVALAPQEQVLVAVTGSDELRRYGPDGRLCEVVETCVGGNVVGVRTGPGRTIWLLTQTRGRYRIYRGRIYRGRIYRGRIHRGRIHRGRCRFRPAGLAELAAALPPSSLVAADDNGFCLREKGPDGEVTACYTWAGGPGPEPPPATGRYVAEGTFTTGLVDSGISRCRWHRVRVDTDLPPGTAVSVSIVVSEDGRYAATDWQTAPPGVTDFLVDQPPGRYVTVRVRLSGDTSATPVLRRVRLDFPRTTSADLLPSAFRQDPVADDFTERFLSLFDAGIAELDQVIERYPALLDPAGVPDQALPWLAGLLGLSFEAGWDSDSRRALIAAAPELYRRRGTPWALSRAIGIVFGVAPVVDELAADRHWAQVRARPSPAGARGLGSVRLFSRSSTRFRLGGSTLGTAPLRSFGDPDADPLTEHAHRFRVLLPAGSADVDAVRRLVDRQAPAHTRGSVRLGGAGFVVGSQSTVGVDTAFVPLPPPVLGGAHPVRLNHDGILRPGTRGARHGLRIGEVSAVGIHTRVS
jgi:phage tail-like protein